LYFKYLTYFVTLFILLLSCEDIERDNILDPKNPASERPQVITVEAFVNTNPSAPHSLNDTLLLALDQIYNDHRSKLSVLEYHRNTTYFTDPFYDISNENLYDIYTGNVGEGVPDVFINGTAARIQGASTIQNSIFRLEQALQPFLIENSYFTIEPTVAEANNQIDISAEVARLGSTEAENIILKAVVIYLIDDDLLKRVAFGIGKSTIIDNIENGEMKEINIDPINKATFQYSNYSVVLMITSEDEKNIYQSVKVEIP